MCKGLATLPATCLKSAKDIKHKISFLLQKTQASAAEQKETNDREKKERKEEKKERREEKKERKEDKEAAVEERAPTAEEAEKWAESFSHVVNSEKGRSVFAAFLRSEFSEENMAFWVACEDYKQAPPSQLTARAQQIYQLYVEADSSQQVNLDAATREETWRGVAGAGPACFAEAQRKIYILMEKDSYRRFLCSKLMQEACHGRREVAAATAGAAATAATTATGTAATTTAATAATTATAATATGIEEKQRRKCERNENWRALAGGA